MNIFRCLVAALLVSLPATAFAGGWTQPKGDLYTKIWTRALFGNAAFDLNGDRLETDSYQMLEFNVYGEFGAAPDFTLIAQATPVGASWYGDRFNGFSGPYSVGARRRFFDKKLQMSLEGRIGGSPGFGDSNLAAPDDPFVYRNVVRTASTGWDLQFGFPLSFGWLAWSVGPTVNTSPDVAHAFDVRAQFGVKFGGLVADVSSQFHWTFEPLTEVNVTGAGDTRYIGITANVAYWFTEHFALNAGLGSALLAQSNAYSPAPTLGVEFRN